jgi:hypothetical protein
MKHQIEINQQNPHMVIDAKTEVTREELLAVLAETKAVLRQVILALS